MATTEQPHGTRRAYQAGCRCTPCRAAEAGYRARLRHRRARQLPILGSHIDARSTHRQIRALRIEGFSKAEIARRLGLPCRRFRGHPERVTLRSALLVSRLYRTVFAEPNELNCLNFSDDATRRETTQHRPEEGQ